MFMGLRQILNIALMLLMLTPSMVCFMASCPEMAHAAVEKPLPPCHGMTQETKSSTGPMLMQECMQNDLGQVATVDIPLPDLALIFVAFILSVIALSFPTFTGKHFSSADPPPKGRASFHRILITQRILQ